MRSVFCLMFAAALGVATAAVVSPGAAADLPGRASFAAPDSAPGACPPGHVSRLMGLAVADLGAEIDRRYGHAAATIAEGSVLASARPAFTWGEATVDACARASGYLRSGVVDDVAVSRCDCFHERMMRYLR